MPIYHFIEYQCRYCGRKEQRAINAGRPNPGKCPRKTGDKPHSWAVNRKF